MNTVTAEMETVYYDDDVADEGDECEVRLGNDGLLIVSYVEEGDERVVYSGRGAHGHFEMSCTSHPDRGGRATLHHMQNSRVLEGFWVEEHCKGFWRIRLPKPLGY